MADQSQRQEPIQLVQVLEEEFAILHGSRSEKSGEASTDRLAQIYDHIHAAKHAALCLSGGGIRSASFGLGILQGMAKHNLLEKFDYLSSVSGGGYIGGWLTGWIHRHANGRDGVINDLKSFRDSKIEPEHEPIRCLREYSNYLTPKWGLLSADTWTWVAIYFRNLLLNWLVLLPLLASVLAIPRLSRAIVLLNPDKDFGTADFLSNMNWTFGVFSPALLIVGFVLAVIAVDYINENLPITGNNKDQDTFLRRCLLPLLIGAVALTTSWAWFRNTLESSPGPLGFVIFGIVLHVAGCSIYLLRLSSKDSGRRRKGILSWSEIYYLSIVVLAGAIGGLLVWCAATLEIFSQPAKHAGWYVCFASPILLTLFLLATTVYIGLASYSTSDADREWWARSGGWILIAIVGWIVLSWLVIFGPEEFFKLHGLTQTIVAGIGGVSGLITVLIGKSSSTPANKKEGEKAGWLALAGDNAVTLAAPIFAAVIVVGISFGTDWLVSLENTMLTGLIGAASTADGLWRPLYSPFVAIQQSPLLALLTLVVLLLAVGIWMGFFINVNKFSLHGAYRERIIRAYLGASHKDRHPNKFTGFDPADNVPMHEFESGEKTKQFEKPFHVINIALNLVSGENLAWQQRKAASFTVTPLHSGSLWLGYRRSWQYGGKRGLDGGDGISLGTAVAISGAAASPNWGYHSSPVVTFLLALFNVRLGWWLGNPGSAGARTFRNRAPGFAVTSLVAETFGLTTARNEYVYLSDGGHFENLGLYEMVLRRCRVIFLSDAGCDPKCELEDLGNAIRKIRIDLGVPIEFEEDFRIYSRSDPDKNRGARYAIAKIKYSYVDKGKPGDQDGVLIYVKPVFYNDRKEPVDIFNYATANREFPHESTLDQWFSETQFESYRMLGLYTVDQILQEIRKQEWQGTSLEAFFSSAPIGAGAEDAAPS